MEYDSDILVIGAGAAGLAAASLLARGGLRVVVVEARDRLGGRMFTRLDPVCRAPVELGAEFLHGRPPQLWNLARKLNQHPAETTGRDWIARAGALQPCDVFSDIDTVLRKMNDRRPDQSFSQFLRACCADVPKETKQWACRYITGFHAADPGLIGIHSLVRGLHAEEEVEGDRTFRFPRGYVTLSEYFSKELKSHAVPLELGTVITNVNWSAETVEVQTCSSGCKRTISAARVLITLPLGVLQTGIKQGNPPLFTPSLPDWKLKALDGLAMGKVVRVTLRFKTRFWDDIRPRPGGPTLADMRFLLSDEDWFPTWWTTLPARLPMLTAWAPFDHAEALSNRDESVVVGRALQALGRILKAGEGELRNLFEAAYTHDWQADPFSLGAYSYAKAGAADAQRQLAHDVEGRLYFAGEATDFSGHNGTVHGALASGYRAADEILRSLGKMEH